MASLIGCIASFMSFRPSTFQPLGWPAPLSVLSTATHFAISAKCACVYAYEPSNPSSSPPHNANRMLRRGAFPSDAMARATSTTLALSGAIVLRTRSVVP